MFRKLFAVLTLVLALPAFANAAWTVKASSANPTYGTVTPSGYNAYADSDKAAKTFTVTPGGNYQVSSILVDNVDVKSGIGTQTVSVPYKFGTTILVAKFTAKQYSVTAGAVTGKGSITSTSPVLVNAGANKTFSILPNPGNRLLSVQDNGNEVTPISASGMSYTVSDVQAAHVITATFGGVTANAGVAQNTVPGVAVTLKGSGTAFNTANYKWTVVYAPVGSGLTAGSVFGTTAQPTFNKSTVGTYNFQLEVSDSVDTTAKAYATTSVNVYADYKAAALATVNSCIVCHAPQAEFTKSYHWNNHLEYGPEFTGGEVEGQLNANESWYTNEDGKLTTCSGRCHFKSKTNAVGCNTCHASGQFNGSTLQNTTVLGMDAPLPNTTSTCLVCHSGSKHGKVPNEFFGSAHWQNHFEYGDEFGNQMDAIVNGGFVRYSGASNGYLNANDSYTTTENGGVVSCAYRCHFRPGQGPKQDVAGYLKDGHSTTYVTYTDTTGKYGTAGTVYSRPGGNSCMACHDPHGLEATAQSTCYTCHAGGNHGWSVAAFEKSTHFNGFYAKLEGVDKESCVGCHDAHSLEAGFATMSSATKLDSTGAATGCQKCHTPGQDYAIFNADLTGKAGHFKATDTTGDTFAYVQDMSSPDNTASCVDCHYHNNSPNAGWAAGGHGSMGSPWNRLSATNKAINLQASPWVANGACARCHSAKGYAYFVDSGFKSMTSVVAVKVGNGNVYSPLTCNGCHIPKAAATPLMLQGKLRGTYTGGFKGYYGISTARNYFTANVVDSIQYADNKNSNGCMPCHSPRNTVGQNIKSAFAVAGPDAKLAAGNFGAHHGDYVGPVFNGKGGYDFTVQNGAANNEFAYQDRARHQRIGNYGTDPAGYNGTTNTKGSCVFCHYASEEGHSLEINEASYTNACAKCHPSDFSAANVTAAADENKAALKALNNLLIVKTWQATGTLAGTGTDMSFNAAGVLTGDNAVAEKNIGANFNYSMLTAGDAAAYAHNPSYARRLIFDSIDWLDDNQMNGSAALTIQKNVASVTYNGTTPAAGKLVALTAAELTAANNRLNNPGCMGCHYGTGDVLNGEEVPGIEQVPHYAEAGTTNAQYVSAKAQCNNCHGYGHGTDSPGGTVLADFAESGHAAVEAGAFAEAGDDFKTMDTCNACHTATGFVNFVNSKFANSKAWGTTADTTREIIACNACHSSTNWASSVRAFDTYSAGYGGFGASAKQKIGYAYGKSNVCVVCHAARETGDTLGMIANFTNSSFKNPHYLGAAGVLAAKVGFHYYSDPAKYAYSTFKHDKIGMNNYSSVSYDKTDPQNPIRKYSYSQNTGTDGPCVACHMNNANSHTLSYEKLSLSMPASTGPVVTPAGQGCYGCHAVEVMSVVVEEEKEKYNAAMDLFKAVLASKGMFYSEAYPYFYSDAANTVQLKNWTLVGPTTDGKLNMGAAFNFKLLSAEKGSFVHNRKYTKRLIFDSIDYLQNGAVTGTVNFSNLSSATTPVSAARAYLSQTGARP